MQPTKHPFPLVAVAIFCLVLNGCQPTGERVYPISGRIIFADGSPARFGMIECRSESSEPVIARGRIESDGTFTVQSSGNRQGLIAGTHRMIIVQVIGSPRDGGTIIHNHGLEVAGKYSSYDASDLRIHVQPEGPNQFEFKVDSR